MLGSKMYVSIENILFFYSKYSFYGGDTMFRNELTWVQSYCSDSVVTWPVTGSLWPRKLSICITQTDTVHVQRLWGSQFLCVKITT